MITNPNNLFVQEFIFSLLNFPFSIHFKLLTLETANLANKA